MKNAAVPSILCAVVLLAVAVIAEAQQQAKVPRIGYLNANFPSANPALVEAFRRGLRELGYVEGKNIVIEYRYAEGKLDRLPALAAEIIRLKIDVILVGGAEPAFAVKNATTTIPIVMTNVGDPVAFGLVASLAQPGGNITGLSSETGTELHGKRLELLKESFPKVSRVAVLWNPDNPGSVVIKRALEGQAHLLRISLPSFEIRQPNEIERALLAMKRERADALFPINSTLLSNQSKRIVDLAAKHQVPAIYAESRWVEAGGLMSYGASYSDLYHRAATYVDKILKGAKPADLPVEQPIKFEFIINLKAAKQIGLTIPPNVLVRADRVIK